MQLKKLSNDECTKIISFFLNDRKFGENIMIIFIINALKIYFLNFLKMQTVMYFQKDN